MKKILIMANSNMNVDPRPKRMLNLLKEDYDVSVYTRHVDDPEVQTFIINQTHSGLIKKIAMFLSVFLKIHFFRKKYLLKDFPQFKDKKWNLVISHDLELLPLAFKLSKNVIFDAREYYPKQFEEQAKWKLYNQAFNIYLCKKYLKKCKKVITVSPGLSSAYDKAFSIHSIVQMSLPNYKNISVNEINTPIKIIHHGVSNRSRKIENMIDLASYLGDKFHVSLMLIPSDKVYFDELKVLCEGKSNVEIINHVNFDEIIPTLTKYDIGLFYYEPTNFNIKYCLPNKLFEYIQARLCLAIGPNPDMKYIVESENIGVVSDRFTVENLAFKIKQLTPFDIMKFKKNSAQIAEKYSYEYDKDRIRNLIQNVI